MSIKDLIKNAKTVDMFKELPDKEKNEINLKGKISAAILNKRYELEMNQSEFAKYMGVSQSMISKWESGEYNFSCDSIAQLNKIGIELTVNDKNLIKNSENKISCSRIESFKSSTVYYKNSYSKPYCYESKFVTV